jgi:ubiquinol-cytochrome c reductase subunit 7
MKEAIRRLPAYLQDERAFRISRALDLNVKKDVLPKQQWVTFDDDVTKGRYLQPYLTEVNKEIAELQEWDSK